MHVISEKNTRRGINKMMAMTTHRQFMIMVFLCIVLDIMFFFPPYFMRASVHTIELKGCSIKQFQGNETDSNCNNTLSKDLSINCELPKSGFLFQLPQINYTDYTKWRSKVTAFLSTFMTDTMATNKSILWQLKLVYRHRNNSKWVVDCMKTLLPPWNYLNFHNNTKSYDDNYTMPIDISLLPDYNYILIVNGEQPEEIHKFEMQEMSLKLILLHQNEIKYMAYSKMCLFVAALAANLLYFLQIMRIQPLTCRHPIHGNLVFGLGIISMSAIDLPLEWTNLVSREMTIYLKEIWMDIYYWALLTFAVTYVSDYLVKLNPNEFKARANCSISINLISFGAIAILLFHVYQNICEFTSPLSNHQSSGNALFLAFIIAMIVAALLYTIYLIFLMSKVLSKAARLGREQKGQSDVKIRRYACRLSFILLSTLICVSLTLVDLIYYDVVRYQTQWCGNQRFKYIAAPLGLYAMWNTYSWVVMFFSTLECRYLRDSFAEPEILPTRPYGCILRITWAKLTRCENTWSNDDSKNGRSTTYIACLDTR